MSDQPSFRDQIQDFEAAYDYNCDYLRELLDSSPAGFDLFASARPMTSFRESLPADAYYVAAITVMQHEDCGSCLQLNLKMAVEQGVARELLQTLLDAPEDLPETLQDVRQHTLSVVQGQVVDAECAERIKTALGRAAFAELALCIAGVRIYPTLKRALLKATTCAVPTLDF